MLVFNIISDGIVKSKVQNEIHSSLRMRIRYGKRRNQCFFDRLYVVRGN